MLRYRCDWQNESSSAGLSSSIIKAIDKSRWGHWAAGHWREAPFKSFWLMLMSRVMWLLLSWRVHCWSLGLMLESLLHIEMKHVAQQTHDAFLALRGRPISVTPRLTMSRQWACTHAGATVSGFQSFCLTILVAPMPVHLSPHDLLARCRGRKGVKIWVQICSVCLVLFSFLFFVFELSISVIKLTWLVKHLLLNGAI